MRRGGLFFWRSGGLGCRGAGALTPLRFARPPVCRDDPEGPAQAVLPRQHQGRAARRRPGPGAAGHVHLVTLRLYPALQLCRRAGRPGVPRLRRHLRPMRACVCVCMASGGGEPAPQPPTPCAGPCWCADRRPARPSIRGSVPAGACGGVPAGFSHVLVLLLVPPPLQRHPHRLVAEVRPLLPRHGRAIPLQRRHGHRPAGLGRHRHLDRLQDRRRQQGRRHPPVCLGCVRCPFPPPARAAFSSPPW